MNFYWNEFSIVNLGIDVALIVSLPIFLRWFLSKKDLPVFPKTFSMSYFIRLTLGGFLYFTGIVLISATPAISTFLRIHFLWTFCTIIFPIFLFCASIRYKQYWILFALPLILGFKYYAEVYEPNDLEITRTQLISEKITYPLRIAHISDLQTDRVKGVHLSAAEAIRKFSPDFILFTGDVATHPIAIPEIETFLSKIAIPDRSLFVTGNVDHILNLPSFSEKSGFRIFDRKEESFQHHGKQIQILGLGLSDFRNESLLTQLAQRGKPDYRILMSHYPDSLFPAQKANQEMGLAGRQNQKIDLIFAGHTHGGQVTIPGVGPIMILSKVPRSIGAGGIHKVGDMTIAVSRGLGMEGGVAPQIRVFCKPQLILLTIQPK